MAEQAPAASAGQASAPASGAQTAAASTAEQAPAPTPGVQAPAASTAEQASGAAPASQAPGASAGETRDAGAANDKAKNELASLKPGFVPKDLTAALNDSVINFPTGSAEVPASIRRFLESAASDLKQVPKGYVLEIAGYTDNTGDAKINLELSQKRADAVREALIKAGADPDMLVAKGYGSADPIAGNDTPEGRLRNRRIEYHVVKEP
jgi:outer membrane protein OmpA-like peptidoglycan-associated protein